MRGTAVTHFMNKSYMRTKNMLGILYWYLVFCRSTGMVPGILVSCCTWYVLVCMLHVADVRLDVIFRTLRSININGMRVYDAYIFRACTRLSCSSLYRYTRNMNIYMLSLIHI